MFWGLNQLRSVHWREAAIAWIFKSWVLQKSPNATENRPLVQKSLKLLSLGALVTETFSFMFAKTWALFFKYFGVKNLDLNVGDPLR